MESKTEEAQRIINFYNDKHNNYTYKKTYGEKFKDWAANTCFFTIIGIATAILIVSALIIVLMNLAS